MPLAQVITDGFLYSNYVEGIFWMLVGGLAFKASRDRGHPQAAFAYLSILIIFGVSDWVESTTGAWWRPWWLFAWKAAGVIGVVGLTIGLAIRDSKSKPKP